MSNHVKRPAHRPRIPPEDKVVRVAFALSPKLLAKASWLATEARVSRSYLLVQGIQLLFHREPFRTLLLRYDELVSKTKSNS